MHSNVVFPAGMMGDFISKKLRKTHIITEHWSKIAGILKKPYLSGLTKKIYKNANRILPVSEFLKNNMMDLMPVLKSDKFRIIPNVINSETFTYKKKDIHKDEIHFCAIATWATKKIPDKKPELFIEALAKVQELTEKKIVLTMVGGGDRLNELIQLSKKLKLNTKFTGYQTKASIAEILHISDYYIHASTVETFGVVIVEALMTGTPVICSNVGALPELINESNGILCENTIEEWVDGINKLISLKYDNETIANNVKNKFSTINVGESILKIYTDISN